MDLNRAKYIDQSIGGFICWFLSGIDTLLNMLNPQRKPEVVRKILVIKFWGIGNIILLGPVFKALSKTYSESELHVLTLSMNRELVECIPGISKIHLLNVSSFVSFARDMIKTMVELKRERINLLLDFEQFSHTSTILGFLIGAKQRIGFKTNRNSRSAIYTVQVPYNNEQHMSVTFFDIARSAGVEPDGFSGYDFFKLPQNFEKIREFLPAQENEMKVAILHPGSGDNFVGRRWQGDNFAALADFLINKYGFHIIFTGSRNERELIQGIINRMERRSEVVNASGRLGLKEFLMLVKCADFVVSNDTAPVHMASSLGVPVIGFYGPNTPVLYGPQGKRNLVFYKKLPCSPCITNFNAKTSYCRIPFCILRITLDEVKEKLPQFIESLDTIPRRTRILKCFH